RVPALLHRLPGLPAEDRRGVEDGVAAATGDPGACSRGAEGVAPARGAACPAAPGRIAGQIPVPIDARPVAGGPGRAGHGPDAAPAGDVGDACVPLSELHAQPAACELERAGGRVRTEAAVRGVERAGNGFLVRADGGDLEADAVIVAVPHDSAAEILPPGTS